ncbi:MAG: hypothetical protein R3F20_08285 [Planctomycetota bacterium]
MIRSVSGAFGLALWAFAALAPAQSAPGPTLVYRTPDARGPVRISVALSAADGEPPGSPEFRQYSPLPVPPGSRRRWWAATAEFPPSRAWRRVRLRPGPLPEGRAYGPPPVTILDDGLLVGDASLTLRLDRDPARLFTRLRVGTRGPVLLEDLRVGRGEGEARLEIEESGPLRYVVRAEGEVLIEDGEEDGVVAAPRRFTLLRRVIGHPGEGRLELRADLESRGLAGRGPAVLARGRLARGLRPQVRELREGRTTPRWLRPDAPFDVTLGSGAPPRLSAARGEGATLLDAGLRLKRGRGDVRLRWPDADRETPFAWSLVDDRTLAVELVSSRYPWADGARAGRRLVVATDRAVSEAEWCLEPASRSRLFGSELDAILESSLTDLTWLDWPGEENAGDFRWSATAAGNLEYDLGHGLRDAGRRRRAPDLLAAADRAARHLVRRDRDRAGSGLVFGHGVRHRGDIELGHVWLEGLAASAVARADRELWAEFLDLGAAIRRCARATDFAREPARGLGWTLLNLVVLQEHFDCPEDRHLIDRLLDAFLPDDADWPLTEPLGADGAHFVSSWVLPALMGESLARAPPSLARRAARRRFVAFLRRLLPLVVDEKTGEVARGLVVTPDGRVHASHRSLEGEEILFLVAGVRRAREFGATDLASPSSASGVRDRLRLSEKTHRGKEIAQLLWLASRRTLDAPRDR